MWRSLSLGLLLAILLPGMGWAAQEKRVVRVLTAKTLELEGGEVVRLAAIQTPNRARDAGEKDEPLAQEAFVALKRLAEGKAVTLKAIGKGPDRKGRTIAEVFVEGNSIQQALLREGVAWTYTFQDTRRQAVPFLKAEAEAEHGERGVWAIPEYAVLDAADANGHEGEFRLVQGRPKAVTLKKGKRSYINFGEDWRTDFTLMIAPSDLRRFDERWLYSLEGKTIRVRGWLFTSGGPAMELTHPEQIELR